jgi:colanic acid/amylovoran biosynthesis glycosyltransferase
LNIAFIVTVFPALSETFILSQITGLIDMGHDVEIFSQKKPNDKKAHSDIEKYKLMNKVHYLNIPHNKLKRIFVAIYLFIKNFNTESLLLIRSINFFKYGRKALNLFYFYNIIQFTGKRFDIIHCHFGNNGNIGAVLKEIGIPGKCLTSFHGFDINAYPQVAGKNIYNSLFNIGDLFTTNTEFTKTQVVKLGCDEDKIVILPVGLYLNKFKFFERKVQSNETIKILTVGRLVEKKGHQYAIRAIAKLARKYKNILYLIAGGGSLKNNLQSLVMELKIREHVIFYDEIDQDEAIKLYHEAHIFILPSITASNYDREGQALVLQEAQAVGLPVISTIHNGIPEGVLNGKSGFLVPERNVDALAGKLEYLVTHPEVWPIMGTFGRRFVEDRYDINKLNYRLLNIYKALITDNAISGI